jgi:hypothetical protein
LRILDDDGKPAAARIRLRDKVGKLHPVPAAKIDGTLLAHPRFPDLGVIVKGEFTVDVPDSNLSIEVDRGSEYLPQIITASQNSTREVRLKRWVDMPARGWWSADLHVHRNCSWKRLA